MDKIVTKKIDWIRRVVDIINDNEVIDALAIYGYNNTNIKKLKSIYTNTYSLIIKQRGKRQDLHRVNIEFKNRLNSVNSTIRKDISLYKIAFSKYKVLKKLIPEYYTTIPYNKWREISLMFYSGIKNEPDAINILSEYNVTTKVIDNRIDGIKDVERLSVLRDRERTESKEATHARNEALDDLTTECRKVVGLARLILGNDSGLLQRV